MPNQPPHLPANLPATLPANLPNLPELARAIKQWGVELGFADLRITDIDLASAEPGLQAWLDAGQHGEMDYMASHGMKRARPAELVPGTVRVISARMDYLPAATPVDWRAREMARLADPRAAVVSVYARGRDYHKVLRARLRQLATTDPLSGLSFEVAVYRQFLQTAYHVRLAWGCRAIKDEHISLLLG